MINHKYEPGAGVYATLEGRYKGKHGNILEVSDGPYDYKVRMIRGNGEVVDAWFMEHELTKS